jgi:hypothetical protein
LFGDLAGKRQGQEAKYFETIYQQLVNKKKAAFFIKMIQERW